VNAQEEDRSAYFLREKALVPEARIAEGQPL
jgi:hypothetical protein